MLFQCLLLYRDALNFVLSKWLFIFQVNPFTPRVSYGDIKMVLTFEFVDEILWCDHSNETLSAILSHGTIYI